MSEKSVNGDWGASGLSLADRLHVPGPRERFMSRCDDLAAQYDLTARETEIMGLIAQRKSRAEIEQELFLSHTPQRANACFSGEDVSRRGRSCKPRPCYDAALWHAS